MTGLALGLPRARHLSVVSRLVWRPALERASPNEHRVPSFRVAILGVPGMVRILMAQLSPRPRTVAVIKARPDYSPALREPGNG